MKLRLVAAATAALALAAPASASAAELSVSPVKRCYGHGEWIKLTGIGFTPNGEVTITEGGSSPGNLLADAAGNISGRIRLGLLSGREDRTYTATDLTDPSISASVPITVSAVNVTMGPQNGPPNRLLTIKASGFTLGKTLWAHVRKGRFKRNIKIGSLKKACHVLRAKQRLLPRGAGTGTYKIQFDTFRKYRSERAQFVTYELRVFRTFGFGIASASWSRLF